MASVSCARHLANVAEGGPSGSVDLNACLGASNMASPRPWNFTQGPLSVRRSGPGNKEAVGGLF